MASSVINLLIFFIIVAFAMVFFVSLSIGVGIAIFSAKKSKIFFQTKTFMLGILLGLSNFCSLFFFVNALESGVFSSSVVFGINNIGIVGLGVLVAMLFFGEKLSRLNWLGLSFSILAIVFLSYTKV